MLILPSLLVRVCSATAGWAAVLAAAASLALKDTEVSFLSEQAAKASSAVRAKAGSAGLNMGRSVLTKNSDCASIAILPLAAHARGGGNAFSGSLKVGLAKRLQIIFYLKKQ